MFVNRQVGSAWNSCCSSVLHHGNCAHILLSSDYEKFAPLVQYLLLIAYFEYATVFFLKKKKLAGHERRAAQSYPQSPN